MTLTLDELEDFMEHFHEQNLEKIEEDNMRKAIRHYWNVATPATVESRLQTLQDEGWIEKKPKSSVWIINEEPEEGIGKLFKEAE